MGVDGRRPLWRSQDVTFGARFRRVCRAEARLRPCRRYGKSVRQLLDDIHHCWGYWAPASLGKDVSGGKTKVERDAKEVTNSVLANQARMARLDEKIRKVRVSELFMEIESYRTGLMKASTFKVCVHHCKNVAHNVRRWCS